MRHRIALVYLLPAAVAASGQTNPCDALRHFQMPGTALTITKTESVVATPAGTLRAAPWLDPIAAPIGPYCRAEGEIDSRTGVDGKHYAIGFALALPANWNGRFLFQGGGGLNGSIALPLGAGAAGDTPALARGFAVVTTDTGHKGAVFDGSFFRDQEASLNFAYIAVGKVAVAAKAIIAAHYGRPPAHSYFSGCSTGGREAMLMTQRYPTYFDGVIAGAPAMRTDFSGIGDWWVAVVFNQITPKDAAGKLVPGGAFSDSDRKLIVNSLLEQCDEKDGLRDGMIFHPEGCGFNPVALACQGAKNDMCLAREQVAALVKAFGGPKDSRGNAVYPGFPYDTGIAAKEGIPGLLVNGPSPIGPPIQETQMDVDAAALRAWSDPQGALTRSTWTNLSTFSGHRGKLMFYHGLSDPWFSAWDTVAYYKQMTATNGGEAEVREWSRLFLAPGMGHCGGGGAALDTFDLLTPMVDWVEKGTAPVSVTATGRAFPGRTRPLCAYPLHAQYKGQGDPEKAASFECVR